MCLSIALGTISVGQLEEPSPFYWIDLYRPTRARQCCVEIDSTEYAARYKTYPRHSTRSFNLWAVTDQGQFSVDTCIMWLWVRKHQISILSWRLTKHQDRESRPNMTLNFFSKQFQPFWMNFLIMKRLKSKWIVMSRFVYDPPLNTYKLTGIWIAFEWEIDCNESSYLWTTEDQKSKNKVATRVRWRFFTISMRLAANHCTTLEATFCETSCLLTTAYTYTDPNGLVPVEL